MSDQAKVIPAEPAQKMGGGVRVPIHSDHRPSEDKPKDSTLAAKIQDKHEQAIIAQNAKSLSDQLYEIDEQQHEQRKGTGKGVASTFHVEKPSYSPKINNVRHINQPGGGQACNRF